METFSSLFGATAESSIPTEPKGPIMKAESTSLPPEVEEGNIEYKLKLVSPSASRIEHLVTQMKWRLKEGGGEAIYEIGVEDNGTLTGLTKDELDCSLKTIRTLAGRLDAETTIVRKQEIKDDAQTRFAAEVLVRKIPDDQEFVDIRVAVIGNVDVGKSTLLGVLTHGEYDNGRGRARLNLFRHLHEIQSGRTSSISHEILGFDNDGEVITYNDSCTAEDICSAASKLITFIDLAGHYKYMKTTIFGLTGYFPGSVMLVVGANTGMAGTTREHLGLAIALKIPLLVVITKTDLCRQEALDRTTMQLERILKSPGCNKVPIVVNDHDDVATAAHNFPSGQVTPVFKVSCVNGKNLDLLKSFFFLVPPTSSAMEQEKLLQQPAELQVDQVFHRTKAGTIVGGTLSQGVMREGDKLCVGPSELGEFYPVTVTSIYRNRAPTRVIRAGQAASIALSDVERHQLRRGLVVLEAVTTPYCCLEFEADVFLLFHTTSISKRFQATVHIGNVIQTAIVVDLSRDPLRTGQRAKIRFRFIKQPEYIKTGARILFRERRTKGIGEVTQVFYFQKGSSIVSDYNQVF
ncbi:GTP-binding protein 2-like [Rhopilema esculentum]|uniref:GTP-binding protein 2-like n=1 Tax=Rhopilema esculentum TaxID=499914 RepID=UPI0031DE6872